MRAGGKIMECNNCLHGGDSGKSCVERVPIFSNLTYEEMAEVEMITTSREFRKGEIIYLAGDKGQKLYVIHQGRVKIYRISETGKEQIIRVLGSGDFMGELSLFVHSPFNDNAEALEDTRVCMVDGGRLKQMMGQNPGIAIKIVEELSRRLYNAENLIESLGLQGVEQRVADALLRMSEGKDEIYLSFSKRDLASHIGITQETLSRKLTAFQDLGWIRQSGQRKILILDRKSLEQKSRGFIT
jgi:CRP-like cAMP-binding protein